MAVPRVNEGSGYNKYMYTLYTRRAHLSCSLIIIGVGGYARYHLSDEPNGYNLLARKFEMRLVILCMHKACISSKTDNTGSWNLFLSINF